MSVVVRSVGAYAPIQRVTNDELATKVETSDEWIRSHTGIGARHYAKDGEKTSSLACHAAQEAIKKAQIEPKQIDLIVVASATPDYFGFPATACIVQEMIGASGCMAFDITAGCSGFIFALDMASSWLQSHGKRYALVIGAETLSRIVDWNDRATCVLMGDGAGAVLIENDITLPQGLGISIIGAEGAGAHDLALIQNDRSRTFERDTPIIPYLFMNGKKVYDFAVNIIVQLVQRLIASGTRKLEDYRWIVPHQANARIIQAAARRLRVSESRFFLNIEEYANTSSASIPLALHEMESKDMLKKNDLILMLAFGSGLTYGAMELRW